MGRGLLVVGAGGFIGQRLVRALAHDHQPIVALCRRDGMPAIPGVQTVVGDWLAPEDFSPWIAHSRLVLHLASTSSPGRSAARPVHEITANLLPTVALLEALQEHVADLLYLSSGGALYAPGEGMAAVETALVRPLSYHGAGKIAAEHFIASWCSQYARSATILRPSNVYGPGQPAGAGFGIVPTAFAKLRRDEPVQVWGDGSTVRDYLYIDDLVALIQSVVASPMPPGARVLNASSGVGVSLNELFATIESVSGRTLLRSHTAGRVVDATRVVIDPALAHRAYGWSAATSLREGLRRTWAWLEGTA